MGETTSVEMFCGRKWLGRNDLVRNDTKFESIEAYFSLFFRYLR